MPNELATLLGDTSLTWTERRTRLQAGDKPLVPIPSPPNSSSRDDTSCAATPIGTSRVILGRICNRQYG
jgi:hypothetical protein